MRIVGGRNRGRRLSAPKGAATRPTSDRIRESVFNILVHGTDLEFNGCPVLDLFAGTGVLGFEALSRGAGPVLFIDNAAAAIDLIRTNAEMLGHEGTEVLRADIRKLGAPPAGTLPAGLAFLDPPYSAGLVAPALEAIEVSGWLVQDAVLVIESSRKETIEATNAFEFIEERLYGSIKITFLRFRN